MSISRRKFLKTGATAASALAFWQIQSRQSNAADTPAPGQFQPNWNSLKQYQCPEWFRDAKFGIWAHWSAQCVPEQGDWYARQMYQEGSGDYNFHVANYGHPSKVGFKDINHLWHAENWNPEKLIGLYKAAGAKYFMALAQHHDNFDCWNSRHQPWNSVAIGPKKDIVGIWAKYARAAGMRFGVSCHGSRSWNWFEPAQSADTKGPLAGVPYDGKLTKADGKGLWWEGLDPQDLYAQNHAPMGDYYNYWTTADPARLPSPVYREKFYNRIVDLIDNYQPDLLYFDDQVLPLYEVDPSLGLRITAHHYNAVARRNGGQQQAVLNGKGLNDEQQQCLIQDYERGQSDVIRPHPWQTDTCIGNWHYQRSIYENHGYKTPDQVVKMLVDIVSKNGNLMLNIPVRGDGTIDEDEEKFLEGMAAWMKVNGEAIFATRPWKLSGEGPVKAGGGAFNENARPFTARDFRFTTKGNVLYATALGWPEDGQMTVRTLAANAPGLVGKVRKVSLLGNAQKLTWTQTADGLVVTLPAHKPCDHAYALKIEGLNLAASRPVAPPPDTVHAAADGTLTLSPESASFQGSVRAQGGAVPNLGYWDNAQDTVTWSVHFDVPGTYSVETKTSAANGATSFVLDAGAGASAPLSAPKTANWDDFQAVTGVLKVAGGDHILTIRSANPAAWHPMNLASVILRRIGD